MQRVQRNPRADLDWFPSGGSVILRGMSNHREVLSDAIGEAQRGLAMWGWDAAVPVLLLAGVQVELRPVDQERFRGLDPFKVVLTSRLWNGDSEDTTQRGVIHGESYGLSIRGAFVTALDDLALSLNQVETILTDSEIWP